MELLNLLSGYRKIEVSHMIKDGMPCWPDGRPGFERRQERSCACHGYNKETFILPEDYGTHVDAPKHFYDSARSISDIGLDELFLVGVVIDV
jgi:kynurenine formamidase